MMLQEVNDRLKTVQITEEELWYLTPLYLLLDLHKDEFCKMVDAVGLDELKKRRQHYKRLQKAEEELTAKENYLKAKQRLEELEDEKIHLETVMRNYDSMQMVTI